MKPMKDRIYLSSPHIGNLEQQYVQEAFATNWIAPLGPHVEAFEKSLEGYLGANSKIAALSSGTAALHLALILLGVSKGDEVLCQSMTFSASANPIVYQGATPIFIDSEAETWNLCPEVLESTIKDRIAQGEKPKAIIAVDLYGMPFQADEIRFIASKYQIPLIEDSAEALGSSYKGQKCGTLGDLSILSFNGNKIITTSGGGALVARNSEFKEKAIFLATQARDQAPHYEHSHIGYNYRLSNVCAAIGRGQMEVLEERVAQRRSNHQFYKKLLAGAEGITVFSEPSGNFFSNHWLTCILFDPKHSKATPEALRLALDKDCIESRPLWKPMHLQPVFKQYPYYGASVAENCFKNGLCLPSGSNLSDREKERIALIIKQMLG